MIGKGDGGFGVRVTCGLLEHNYFAMFVPALRTFERASVVTGRIGLDASKHHTRSASRARRAYDEGCCGLV